MNWMTNSEILSFLGTHYPLEEIYKFCQMNAAIYEQELSLWHSDEIKYEMEYWRNAADKIEKELNSK